MRIDVKMAPNASLVVEGAFKYSDAPLGPNWAEWLPSHGDLTLTGCTKMAANIDYYERLTEKYHLDYTPLLIATAISSSVVFIQYVYAISLDLREGRSPIPYWMHAFYLASNSTWSYMLGKVAPRYGEHWFLRMTSAVLFVWATLEVFFIIRAITKERNANFATVLGPDPTIEHTLVYAGILQVAMYGLIAAGTMFMGEGCVMQWLSLSNVLLVLGPTYEYLRRGSRTGLSLGFCLTNIFGTIWTFGPSSFWVLTLPEVFDKPAYYLTGFALTVYSVWTFCLVARYPPKKPTKDGEMPIW